MEFLETGTGRLIPDVELPERTAPDTGAASVEPGDVLFGKLRPYLAKTWLADRPVFASTELLCLRPSVGVDSRWLAYLAVSNPVVEWAVATSDGTKMPRTSWGKLAEYRIDVPSTDEQRAIADYLDRETARIDALIDKKQRMSGLLSERRQALITGAVQGEAGPGATAGGDLVTSFQQVQLRRAFRVVNGGTPTSEPNNWDGDVPWVTPVDLGIVNGGIVRATSRSLSELGLASGSSAVPGGSLIVSTRAPIGYVAEVSERTALNQGCRGLVPARTLDVRYFCYQLLAMTEALQSRGQGSTFQELSSDGLAASSIFLPSLAEQRAIADYLDRETARIDALIEKIDHQIALLREHRRALITVAVTGELEVPGVAA
ncbi:MAG: restriction endonuclease subunit S [Acidimicrobiales bacterium]